MNTLERLLQENNDYEGATHLVQAQGLSTARVCNLLNDLVGSMGADETYLEIGTWQGLTLCSAIYQNAGQRAVACDKFRLWGKWTGWGFKAKKALYDNVARYGEGGADVTFHHMTSRKLFNEGLVPKGVKVYFYDGDHSYEGTKHGVVEAAPMLCEESFLLMDDWNDDAIKKATLDGIKEAGLTIGWMRELEGENGNPEGWWNGLGVLQLLKQ